MLELIMDCQEHGCDQAAVAVVTSTRPAYTWILCRHHLDMLLACNRVLDWHLDVVPIIAGRN